MSILLTNRHVLFLVLSIAILGECMAQDVTSTTSESTKACQDFVAAINTGDAVKIEAYVRQSIALPADNPELVASSVQQLMSLSKEHPKLSIKKYGDHSGSQATAFAQDSNQGWIQLSIAIEETQPSDKSQTPKIVGFGYGDTLAPIDLLPDQKLTDDQLKQKIGDVFKSLIAHDGFSGTIEARRNGSTIYQLHHGYRDADRAKPVDEQTRFNLASITKMFTAVAIAQLVEQGKIDWDTKVGQVLQDFPNQEIAQQVTISNLLAHTSGVVGAGRTVNERLTPISARTVVESFGKAIDQPLQFRPGQQFDYSNFGYSILGRIIEQASHQSYHDYVRDHVFKPSGMTQTDFLDLEKSPANFAAGFMDEPNGKRKDNREMLSVIGMPYGGAYSNTEDMNRFYTALLSDKLVTAQTRQQMWHGVVEPEPDIQYGYGIQMRDYGGRRFYYHGGGWPGVTCHYEFCPELDYTLVLLSNFDINTHAVAYRLREWLTQGNASSAEPQSDPKFSITAELLSKSPKIAESLDITVNVTNEGGLAHGCVVDFEVKNKAGEKIDQQFTVQQRFEHGGTRSYRYSWTPKDSGDYSIDIGVFGSNWKPKYEFKHSLLKLSVAP